MLMWAIQLLMCVKALADADVGNTVVDVCEINQH